MTEQGGIAARGQIYMGAPLGVVEIHLRANCRPCKGAPPPLCSATDEKHILLIPNIWSIDGIVPSVCSKTGFLDKEHKHETNESRDVMDFYTEDYDLITTVILYFLTHIVGLFRQ